MKGDVSVFPSGPGLGLDVPLLELADVTKSFGAVRALKGVSFDLLPGEVHALLGENGAGKSTLVKLITGAHQPDGGMLRVAGEMVRHLTPAAAHRMGIACIYQQPALFADLTVAENISLRLEEVSAVRRVNWRECRKRARELLEFIGARLSPDAEVRSLSMPEQQLVEIACVVGAGARIVIMDEPTASLTRSDQERLFGIIADLRVRLTGIIYISHRLEEIFELADRVTVLRDGRSIGTRRVRRAAAHPQPSPSAGADHDTLPATITRAELIHMMVGREVSHLFPPAESEPAEVMLLLQNVGCRAGGIHAVNLAVRAGEVVGLAGLVGSGRTELARVLFGLTPADAGEISLQGRRVKIRSPAEAVAHGIAYLPEDRRRHGVVLEMPLAHNVSLAVQRRLFPGGWVRSRAERELALRFMRSLDIKAPGPESLASRLSGGNQQKVALARWLATQPGLLILDEPTQGVDVGTKAEIHRIIRQLTREGVAVLMISSDLPEIVGMSDRIAVMREGTIAEVMPGGTTPHEVMAVALGQKGGQG
jgi:rhamnose transport system ATP-binding protein